MEPPIHVVRLELWLDSDAPTGRAIAAGAKPRQFTGWLGLVTAVDTLIAGATAPLPDSASDSTVREPEVEDGPGA
jgi:hypothetical protein